MDEIALHIDFLLHTHDCVIVPGLGGFVVNMTEVERDGLWGLNAPMFELLFNNKLTYNDGLLAESLMKTNNVSYEVAIKQIKSACEELKKRLLKDDEVVCDNLGSFKINKENNLIFLPNKAYIRPRYFGLSNSRLKPAALALSPASNDENAIPVRTIMRYVSTAIAAAVVLFFVVLSYNNSNHKNQYAEMVSKPLMFGSSSTKVDTPKSAQPTVVAPSNTSSVTDSNDTMIQTQSSTKSYFIIVGVYEVREVAENTLSKLKNQGFQDASMIERPKRLDVYSASFSSRDEAQTFLHKFQTDNPQYRDAWILKR